VGKKWEKPGNMLKKRPSTWDLKIFVHGFHGELMKLGEFSPFFHGFHWSTSPFWHAFSWWGGHGPNETIFLKSMILWTETWRRTNMELLH
jgi:hypothetical protein